MPEDNEDKMPPQETPAAELTLFQQTILYILAAKEQHGLGIKAELEQYYGTDVNHGRLYPNLDQLVEQGYVKKGEIDKRTNRYTLSETGHAVLTEQLIWELNQIKSNPEIRDELETILTQE